MAVHNPTKRKNTTERQVSISSRWQEVELAADLGNELHMIDLCPTMDTSSRLCQVPWLRVGVACLWFVCSWLVPCFQGNLISIFLKIPVVKPTMFRTCPAMQEKKMDTSSCTATMMRSSCRSHLTRVAPAGHAPSSSYFSHDPNSKYRDAILSEYGNSFPLNASHAHTALNAAALEYSIAKRQRSTIACLSHPSVRKLSRDGSFFESWDWLIILC